MARLALEHFGLQALRLTPPRPMERIHHHHEVELNFVFSGAVTYLHQGRPRQLVAGRLAVFWGAVPHSMVAVAPRTDMAWLTVPLAVVRGWGMPAGFMRDLLAGGWIQGPAGRADRFPVAAWVEELGAAGPATPTGLQHELQGCLCWLAAHGSVPGGGPRPNDKGLEPVEKMACVMAERYQDPLDVAAVARAAGLHPNYAMALFRKRCGVTIGAYLTQLRLMHAQRMLLETDKTIADVAFASGFASLSAFYETFARRVKLSPTAFRSGFGAEIRTEKKAGRKVPRPSAR